MARHAIVRHAIGAEQQARCHIGDTYAVGADIGALVVEERIVDGKDAPPGVEPDADDMPLVARLTSVLEAHGGGHGGHGGEDHGPMPKRLSIFFSIYFGMTGLHAIHVIAGIFAISWILRRAIRGDFNPQYYGAVDNVGLYWHIVDLVWIYLFPLLYLLK